MRSSIWPLVGLTTISGSTRPVGRTICSTTWSECSQLVGPGRGRQEHDLADAVHELLEPQRPVVGRRRQPEPVLDQRAPCGSGRPRTGRGAGARSGGSRRAPPGSRRGSSRAACRAARPAPRPSIGRRVVLDAVAVADLGHHLEVVLGAHAQPLGLEQLALLLELGQPLLELGLDAHDGRAHALLAGHVVGGREDDELLELGATFSPVSGSTTMMRSTSSPNSSMRTAVSS